jgi:hypothetical protein
MQNTLTGKMQPLILSDNKEKRKGQMIKKEEGSLY